MEANNSPTGGTFKSALSSLKRAATNTSNKSNASFTPGDDLNFNMPNNPLPDNPRDLEGFLNRHLSGLDHLRSTVDARNQEIKEYSLRAAYYYSLRPLPDAEFLKSLDAEIELLRAQRDGFKRLVKNRQQLIVRIADHRKALDEAKGLKCTVYEMYLGFRKIEEWEQRFSY
jgi:hypothetical protein